MPAPVVAAAAAIVGGVARFGVRAAIQGWRGTTGRGAKDMLKATQRAEANKHKRFLRVYQREGAQAARANPAVSKASQQSNQMQRWTRKMYEAQVRSERFGVKHK